MHVLKNVKNKAEKEQEKDSNSQKDRNQIIYNKKCPEFRAFFIILFKDLSKLFIY